VFKEGDDPLANLVAADKPYGLEDIFDEMKGRSKERKFNESVELLVKLNVDPTKGD